MKQLFDYFLLGGSLMWVLLGCSVLGFAIILERGLLYAYFGWSSDAMLARVLAEIRAGRNDAALKIAKASRHPVARIVETYLTDLRRPAQIRRDNLKRVGSLCLEKVELRLRVLAAISHLTPLIGLLGTVAGMVVAFAHIQTLNGPVKPADLAGGIWEALLTTVFGLVVAIPCMAAFHAFESHADKIARRMELAVTSLDDVLSGLNEAVGPKGVGLESNSPADDWNTVAS